MSAWSDDCATRDLRAAPAQRSSIAFRSERTSDTAASTLVSAARTTALPTTTPSASAATDAACSGPEIPKPTHTGSFVAPRKRSIVAARPLAISRSHSGHAEPADEIHESAAVPRDLRHARRRRGRCDEPNECERRLADLPLDLGVAAHGKIGDEQTVNAGCGRACERARSRGDDRVQIAEQHERHIHRSLGRQLEHAVERHPLLERALRARLDDRTIGERIGERHAELDHVGAGARRCLAAARASARDPGCPAVM